MKQDLVISSGGRNVTTSLIVAETFGKEHFNVLRDIRELDCSEEFNKLNFEFILRTTDLGHGRKREDPYYELTKDGFSFLVMGYTGEKAAQFKEKFISEFNKREQLLNDDDYILQRGREILEKKVKVLEQSLYQKDQTILLQEKTIKEVAPKVEYHDSVLQSVNTWTTTTIAKELGMSAIALNKFLLDKDVQFYRDKHWVLYQKYADKGYMKTRTFTFTKSDGSTGTNIESVWTEEGRKFIHDLRKKFAEAS